MINQWDFHTIVFHLFADGECWEREARADSENKKQVENSHI